MLHKETVTSDTLELLTKLMKDEELADFILVGGTVTSLHDIAAMKLNAISGNGTRIKDFIDIAHLGGFKPLFL